MTQEEKAHAYDEIRNKIAIRFGTNVAKEIFSQFEESKDERIRKAAIEFVRQNKSFNYCLGISKEEVVAWLEKKDKQPKKISIWKHWSGNDIVGNGDGNKIYLTKIGNVYELSSCLVFECDYIELSELNKLMQEEKQGEQKPTDKIEPKFKVGDWITNGEYTWKIIDIKPIDYILQSQNGNIVNDTITYVDEEFHLERRLI